MGLHATLFFRSVKNVLLNFGPQHPAAHGVLRLVVELTGEFIKHVEPHIGLLHRGTEKLIEFKTFKQAVPYFDRLDYVSAISQEHCFSRAVEHLQNLKVSMKSRIIRVIFSELTRILNHLLALTTHGLDVGALTPFLWAFEEREKLMGFYEKASGARFHAAFVRPGGLASDLPDSFFFKLNDFSAQFPYRIDELEDMLTDSRIWKQRLRYVGVISARDALSFGFSGVMLRGSGISWDLRKSRPYEDFDTYNFVVPVGIYGDCYDRYKVRVDEMKESLKIIRQAVLKYFKLGAGNLDLANLSENVRFYMKYSMEMLIYHFKNNTSGEVMDKSTSYAAVEAPKGEFAVALVSNQVSRPQRCRIKAPGFLHLQSLDFMSKFQFIADLVAIIGTQDIVFGEIDR